MAAAAAPMDTNFQRWIDNLIMYDFTFARSQLRPDQDVNLRGVGGVTALHVLAELGRVNDIERLMKEQADMDAADDQGRTPLDVALYYSQTLVVIYLTKCKQIERALATRLGHTPPTSELHSALFDNEWQEFRDDVKTRCAEGGAKLVEAARVGDLAAVQRMVESGGVHVDAIDMSTGESAFSVALAAGRLSVCVYLMDRGAHARARCVVNGKDQPVLLTAVNIGNAKFVRHLLAHGVRISNERQCYPSALSVAVESGCNEMIDVLLDAGAELGTRYNPNTPSVIHAAIDAPNLPAQDKAIWQRLIIACWHQDTRRIQLLFDTYEKLQDRDLMAVNAANALFIAVYQKNDAIVADLLARGASLSSTGVFGVTAMVAAVYIDSLRMLREFLDRGGDPSVVHCSITETENDVDSLLSTACFAGSKECANFLFSMETRPYYREKALTYVISGDDEAFVRRLLYESLPVSEMTFCSCASHISSATILDVYLTWGCENYGIEILTQAFLSLCAGYRHAFSGPGVPMDLLPVYVAHGMDPNAGRGVKSALAIAVGGMDGCRPEIVRLLVDSGADLNSDDFQGRSALAIVEDELYKNWSLSPDVREKLEVCRVILQGGQ